MKEFWRMLGLLLLWGFINTVSSIIGVIAMFARNPSIPHMDRSEIAENVRKHITLFPQLRLRNIVYLVNY